MRISLRSKLFQWSYCAKVKVRAQKKRWKGEGEGRRGNACPQTPRFWKTPLDISRLGSFLNWQLVTDYPWITRFVKLLCSLIEHVPGDCKNCNFAPFPLPPHSFFFLLSSQLSLRTRAETLAMQASEGGERGQSVFVNSYPADFS